MHGQVALMNRALGVFAGSRIVSPSDGTAEARHCFMSWDGARDAVLAVYPWGFATKWARLAKNLDAPPFGFVNSYALPPDFLYLIDVRATDELTAQPDHHAIVGGAIYTDADQALARYVFRHESCALWPPHFCEAFTVRLAVEVAPFLAQEAGIGIKLREIYHQALALAATADARQDNAPQLQEPCDYIDARMG